MNRINYRRVVGGGLLAGLVVTVGEYLLNEIVIAERWLAVLSELGIEPPGAWAMAMYVILTFILGIAIVWLYAAMRPRFGPGPRTAACTGFFVWFLIWLWSFGGSIIWGFFPGDLVLIIVAWGLVEVVAAALAGGWLYRERSDGESATSDV